ncbi:MAG: hypothetical protein V7638_4376 [Acidobacteriota bacterium]
MLRSLLRKETYGAWHCLPVLTVFVLATLITDAHFQGDTADYVDSIVAHAAGRDYWFWEFGHVLWRPFGWLVMVILRPLLNPLVGTDVRIQALHSVLAINWVAGFVTVAALYGILNRLLSRWWAINLAVVAFIFSHGFLNFSQTGAAYIPGLAFLTVGFYLLVLPKPQITRGLLAGVALGFAVCMWLPYVLALPAIVLAPIVLRGSSKTNWKLVISASLVCGVVAAVLYLVVMIGGVGISDLAGVKAWAAKTAGGPAQDKSLQRMVFGFARSFIYMGNDGMLFKRFLVHDPLNPVTAFDLLRLSLWKVALFYLFIAALVVSLVRWSQNWRILALLIINGLPIIGLAVFWQGGDIERYLGLYPVIFLSLGASLSSDRSIRWLKYLLLFWIAALVLTDTLGMAKFTLNRQQEKTAVRAAALQPVLNNKSWVFAVTFQDDFVNFNRSFPFHPVNRHSFNPFAIVAVGTTQAPVWRQDFLTKVEEAWNSGGDVWVSKRVFSQRPLADWNWVEGDDKSVSWADIYNFFSQLEFAQSVGGDDGFALLTPSDRNRAVLRVLAREEK